jgi:hypothetical protein
VTDRSEPAREPQSLHWGEAAYHWPAYGPPLRPGPADVRAMEAFVARWQPQARARPLEVLLLGVTPEIATMAWPQGTRLLAVDKSRPMIDRVWPGDAHPHRRAVCADWFDLARTPDRFDIVVGDGVHALLRFPAQYRALAALARGWLHDDGLLLVRTFILPALRESPSAVFADLGANRIASFHAFKLRLAMSMQASAQVGVRTGDVFAAWDRARVDRAALLAATGWAPEVLETIRPWEGKDARLSFPTADEFAAVMGEHFDCDDEYCGPGELGVRCPIASYRARRSRPPGTGEGR